VKLGTAQVGVNHQGGIPPLGANIGQIAQGGGLPFPGAPGNKGQGNFFQPFLIEFYVRPQNAVGFRVRPHDIGRMQNRHILGNNAQDGNLKSPFHIFHGLHGGIHEFQK